MDIISHALIGNIISLPQKKSRLWVIFFSVLPDLTQIPFFLYLGYLNARPFFFPLEKDWDGARALHPFLNIIYEIPHSFFFVFLIILPIVLFFKLPKLAFFAYIFHLLIDLPTHTSGEWAMKPFWPFQYTFPGFTDAWAWPAYMLLISWIVLIAAAISLNPLFKNKEAE